MPLKLNISPRIIPNVASIYTDTNRIFMEYIDNSIDSAEEFFDEVTNSYSRNISITLTMTSDSVTVEDNCYGITNFEKIVQEVGNSDKKAQPWTNGQFGYGIYSFLAGCENLSITSKLRNEPYAKQISIHKSQFDTDHQDDVVFPDPSEIEYEHISGTRVIMSGFEKSMWRQIEFSVLINEIENHFEHLLKRSNLTIKLIDHEERSEYVCKSFDYDQYEGEEYIESLSELKFTKGRKYPKEKILKPANPIDIYLKVTNGKAINKPPVFISKGRRIAEIAKVNSFKSKYKSEIWGHPSLTGYVDLSDFLEPTIARNDFRNTNNSTALFSTLKELEPLILDVIQNVNKESESKHYKTLENELNRVLSKLAKIDAMNFRTEHLSGKDINLQQGGSGQSIEEGFGTEHHRNGPPGGVPGVTPSNPKDDPHGFGPTDEEGNNISDNEGEGNLASNKEAENPFEDTGFTGGKRKKSGFNIQLVVGDPIIDEDTNKMKRSQLIGGNIRIFREHPDFEDRIKYSRTKEPKVSQRLITYLAGEITVHYKDILQIREGQPEYNVRMFEDLVEFIYKFEDGLEHLEGENLSKYSE